MINEVSVWNIGLTQSQIQSIMNNGPNGNENYLVGYWNFNEGSGETVYDLSGNENHGTIHGATWSTDVPTSGCTDPLAYNYNPDATIDDGSCEYGTPQISISLSSLDFSVTPPEYEQSQTLTISNTGDASLEVELSHSPTIITDIDGNVYETVEIGDQMWMKENLKVTHYNDGTEIPTGYSNSEWRLLSTPAYAVYNDNESNSDSYGNLYNWFAVDDARGVCPDGWHVPTDDEYTELTDYLGGQSVAGGKM